MDHIQQKTISLNLLLNCLKTLESIHFKREKVRHIEHDLKLLYSMLFNLFKDDIKIKSEDENFIENEIKRLGKNVN